MKRIMEINEPDNPTCVALPESKRYTERKKMKKKKEKKSVKKR